MWPTILLIVCDRHKATFNHVSPDFDELTFDDHFSLIVSGRSLTVCRTLS